jgi:bifunctional ADP-heptose synthase (sugar kinase/adenylyltransferase)
MNESVFQLIESVRDYRVLFVGDVIIDEYHYVSPLGKSAKENLIPVRYESKEVFGGGVEAAAKHLMSFCKTVDISDRGNITRKVRMVDKDYMRKLFEVHYTNGASDNYIHPKGYDTVVVADFGHGAIDSTRVEELCRDSDFLAVSAQTNSANAGFNLITKYRRADYIVIDEPEARLAAADRDSRIEDVIRKLARDRCEKFVVTHGRHGAYGYHAGRFYHQMAFTDLVRDTMGAGDAFFSVTAPMAKTGNMEDLLLIGCAAGALKCQIFGHRSSITKEMLIEFIGSIRRES